MSDDATGEGSYGAFLAGVFGLLQEFDADTLYSFRSRKPQLGPEFVRVVDSLAEFRAVWVEGRSAKRGIRQATGAPLTHEDRALIEDIFRDRTVFPSNDDLKAFARTVLGLDIYGKNYSRAMIADRVFRAVGKMDEGDRAAFREQLHNFRDKLIRGDSTSSFLRSWSRIINGDK